MFVSTVRSRHRVDQMAAGTCEFGFLSEAQLVNTALTRAKSWLAVVGDPVALCSLGNCGALWRSYLRHCEKVGGLHPADLSLEDIWQHSQSLTHLLSVNSLSADIADISPVKQLPVRQSQANGHMSATSETSATVSETVLETQLQQLALSSPYILSEMSVVDSEQQPTVDGSIDTKAKVTGTVTVSGANGIKACAKQATSTHRAQTLGRHVASEDSSEDEKSCSSDESDGTVSTPPTTNIVSFTDWSLDYQLDADEIIGQLAKVCMPAQLCLFSLASPKLCVVGWVRQKSQFLTNIWLSDQWLLEFDQQLQRSTMQFTAQTATHQCTVFHLSQPAGENRTEFYCMQQ